ncbi:MAG TPA: prepilin-type N-terminal cleavage/methylation domain-containing protein, partial [Longimicrobiales bacterium]|nr:prepilin-type N-terminal cleavage/methylation domain-containing protein [Longimicrobiales bacterium]
MNAPLKNRAGFTLVEVLIALVLSAVLGAAFMGAFVSQSRFFDHQEKVSAARDVSRGALNIMMSEMRMVELSGGVVPTPTNEMLELRVPYVFGMVCSSASGELTITVLPADLTGIGGMSFSGFAYRTAAGGYTYIETPVTATSVGAAGALVCSGAGIVPGAGVVPNGDVITIPLPATVPAVGTPIFLYRKIKYEFAPSGVVAGTALWRHVAGVAQPEELVAPFDTTAKFRFFVNDAATAQDAVPATLTSITGIEIVLDALSERPNADGTHQSVPLTTAVHFR